MVHNNHNIFKDISVAPISMVHILLGFNAAFIRMFSDFLNPKFKNYFWTSVHTLHSVVGCVCVACVCMSVGMCACMSVCVCKHGCLRVSRCVYV